MTKTKDVATEAVVSGNKLKIMFGQKPLEIINGNQSSVEVVLGAKGNVVVTVKCYHDSPAEATKLALEEFGKTLKGAVAIVKKEVSE